MMSSKQTTLFINIGSPEHIRGYLDRYAIEISPGVWIANLTARVREQIWELLQSQGGKCLLAYHDSTSHAGYRLKTNEAYTRIVEIDGLYAVDRTHQSAP